MLKSPSQPVIGFNFDFINITSVAFRINSKHCTETQSLTLQQATVERKTPFYQDETLSRTKVIWWDPATMTGACSMSLFHVEIVPIDQLLDFSHVKGFCLYVF